MCLWIKSALLEFVILICIIVFIKSAANVANSRMLRYADRQVKG
jgi:hypothetical protein